jgi:DNA repair protein RadC
MTQQLDLLTVETNKPPTLKAIKETPARRMAQLGPSSLATLELISAVVGNPDTALKILNAFPSLAEIARASWYDLSAISGMGPIKTAALKACLELGRRLLIESPEEKPSISTPADAYNMLTDMAQLEQEQMRVILMDTRNRVQGIHTIYQGSLNTTMVRVGELFREAIRCNCAGIIVAHNHPSGDPSPSPEDVAITRDIVAAGKLTSVEVLDHIVVGRNRFVSLKERGLGF